MERRRATPEERKVIFRDVLIFQVKLALDAAKDLVLSPLAILAAGADLVFPTDRIGKRFYHVLRMGEKFDRWMSLYSAAEHADAGEGGLFAESRAGSDTLLGKIEAVVLGRDEPRDPWLDDYSYDEADLAATAGPDSAVDSDAGSRESPSPDRPL